MAKRDILSTSILSLERDAPDNTILSMATMQGSLSTEFPRQENNIDLSNVLRDISSDSVNERVHRCMKASPAKAKRTTQLDDFSSYEAITNKLYFGALSLEEKYFVLKDSDHEIQSAADILKLISADELNFPSFQEDIDELLSFPSLEERLDESKKFQEMRTIAKVDRTTNKYQESDICSIVTDQPNSMMNNTTMPPVQFHLGPVDLDFSPKKELPVNGEGFRLTTEEEHNRNQDAIHVSSTNETCVPETPTYISNHLSFPEHFGDVKTGSSSNTPDCSLTNLEHPSYQRSFNIFPQKRINSNILGSLAQLHEPIVENVCQKVAPCNTEKKDNATNCKKYSNKPIIVAYKRKVPQIYPDTACHENSIDIIRTKSKLKRKHSKSIKHSLSDTIQALRSHRVLRKASRKNKSLIMFHSCSTIDNVVSLPVKPCKNTWHHSRPNNLYNLEASSLHSIKNIKKIVSRNESTQSEPMCQRRSQSLDNLCDETFPDRSSSTEFSDDNESIDLPPSITLNKSIKGCTIKPNAIQAQKITVMYPSSEDETNDSSESSSHSNTESDELSATITENSVQPNLGSRQMTLRNQFSNFSKSDSIINIATSLSIKSNSEAEINDDEFENISISLSSEVSELLSSNNFNNYENQVNCKSSNATPSCIGQQSMRSRDNSGGTSITLHSSTDPSSFVNRNVSIDSLEEDLASPENSTVLLQDDNYTLKKQNDSVSEVVTKLLGNVECTKEKVSGVMSASCADRLYQLTSGLNSQQSYNGSGLTLVDTSTEDGVDSLSHATQMYGNISDDSDTSDELEVFRKNSGNVLKPDEHTSKTGSNHLKSTIENRIELNKEKDAFQHILMRQKQDNQPSKIIKPTESLQCDKLCNSKTEFSDVKTETYLQKIEHEPSNREATANICQHEQTFNTIDEPLQILSDVIDADNCNTGTKYLRNQGVRPKTRSKHKPKNKDLITVKSSITEDSYFQPIIVHNPKTKYIVKRNELPQNKCQNLSCFESSIDKTAESDASLFTGGSFFDVCKAMNRSGGDEFDVSQTIRGK